MQSFVALLAASSLATLALASPVPDTSAKGSFVINQSTVAKKPKSGPQALAAAYAKHGKAVPANIANAANTYTVEGSGSGSDPAYPEEYDKEYLCPVTIGGQTVNLDFDTGSADLWTFSSEQPTAQRSGHDIYTPSKSSTSQKLSGYTWKISYGDGSGASGDVYRDTVTVGGVTVTGQAVEAAQTVSAQFQQDQNNDGLLGLAFSSINTVRPQSQTTFFDTAIKQGKLSQNLFTVDLKKGKTGSYGFGAIDSSKYTGSITYTSVDNSQGFWTFTSSGYGVGTSYTTKATTGIADTGTTLLLLPDAVVNAYYAKVSGASYDSNQGGYTFPCSAKLPNFVVGVGSSKYTIPGSYINFAPVDSTYCYGGLQSSSDIGINIYGDIFLKAIFAVFDSNGPRLGFASKTL